MCCSAGLKQMERLLALIVEVPGEPCIFGQRVDQNCQACWHYLGNIKTSAMQTSPSALATSHCVAKAADDAAERPANMIASVPPEHAFCLVPEFQ